MGLHADTADKAVGNFRLDDVAQHASKVALNGRGPDVHACLNVDAIERIVVDGGRACQAGRLTDGVVGVSQRGLGNHAPSAGRKRQGEMRVNVDAAHVAGVEIGLGAGQVTEGRSPPPVEGRIAERAVENVVAQAGQVEDSGFVAVGGAGKGLKAVHRDGGNEAIVLVG